MSGRAVGETARAKMNDQGRARGEDPKTAKGKVRSHNLGATSSSTKTSRHWQNSSWQAQSCRGFQPAGGWPPDLKRGRRAVHVPERGEELHLVPVIRTVGPRLDKHAGATDPVVPPR